MAAIVAGALLLTAALTPASLAAAPNPNPGSATVDGAIGDWSLSADFFSDMTAGGVAGRDVRAKLYLKYDCDSEVLYALVLSQGGEKILQDADGSYIMIDGSKLIESDNGSFAWVDPSGDLAAGFEGSTGLAPGSYTLRAHVLVADDSDDGYQSMDTVGRYIPLVIECGGVQPTQAAGPVSTLPPTDTFDQGGPSSLGGARLLLVLLGLGSFAALLLTRSRRQPETIEVEETEPRR
jgi:hypothetical protein